MLCATRSVSASRGKCASRFCANRSPRPSTSRRQGSTAVIRMDQSTTNPAPPARRAPLDPALQEDLAARYPASLHASTLLPKDAADLADLADPAVDRADPAADPAVLVDPAELSGPAVLALLVDPVDLADPADLVDPADHVDLVVLAVPVDPADLADHRRAVLVLADPAKPRSSWKLWNMKLSSISVIGSSNPKLWPVRGFDFTSFVFFQNSMD